MAYKSDDKKNLNKNELIVYGTIEQIERNVIKVKLEVAGNPVIDTHVAGAMRSRRIRIVKGDRVRVKINANSPDRGIIVYRENKVNPTPAPDA